MSIFFVLKAPKDNNPESADSSPSDKEQRRRKKEETQRRQVEERQTRRMEAASDPLVLSSHGSGLVYYPLRFGHNIC